MHRPRLCALLGCIWLTLASSHPAAHAMGKGGSAPRPPGGAAFAGHLLLLGAGLDSNVCRRNARLGLVPSGRRCGRRGGMYMATVDGPQPNSGGDDDRELFGQMRAGRAGPAQSFDEAPAEVTSTQTAARTALWHLPDR